MKISSSQKLLAGILISGFVRAGHAQELDDRWRLRVMDLKQQVRVEATIRFARETAEGSCMAGPWKRVVVEATAAQEEAFFPLAQPLAYRIENGTLTVGRTTVCDGYLFLSGKLETASIQGIYNAVGLGSGEPLGSFTLDKVQ